ncbi:hypothetical protein [Sulfurimonas sp. CS5]|jgi:hypothetical protein|uniref:hypothetical protein n=1 Tax=Sulfurimonas sp. CS5 TaxID=3391145 RepID=UPI0039E74477
MKTLKYLGLSLVVALGLGFSGCSASGQQFSVFKNNKEKATVYFYRPDAYFGIIRTVQLFEVDAVGTYENKGNNSKSIGNLRNNSYFKYEFSPGTHKFRDNLFFDPSSFELKANDYTCIRFNLALIGTVIDEVDKKTCADEIKETKEMKAADQYLFN